MGPQLAQPWDIGPDVFEHTGGNVPEIASLEKSDFRIEVLAHFVNFEPRAASASLIFGAQVKSRLPPGPAGRLGACSEAVDGEVLPDAELSIEPPGAVPVIHSAIRASGASIDENTAKAAPVRQF